MTIAQFHICRSVIDIVPNRTEFLKRFPNIDPGELVDTWTLLQDCNFATVRAMSGLTQAEFASRYGIPLNTVQAWSLSPNSPNKRNIQPYLLDLLAVDVINVRAAEIISKKI